LGEAKPGPVCRVEPSCDRVRFEVDVGDRDRAHILVVPTEGDEAASLVPFRSKLITSTATPSTVAAAGVTISSWNTWRNPDNCSSVSLASTVI
jgi:hypothetical protein